MQFSKYSPVATQVEVPLRSSFCSFLVLIQIAMNFVSLAVEELFFKFQTRFSRNVVAMKRNRYSLYLIGSEG